MMLVRFGDLPDVTQVGMSDKSPPEEWLSQEKAPRVQEATVGGEKKADLS